MAGWNTMPASVLPFPPDPSRRLAAPRGSRTLSDTELLVLIRDGDDDAFGELWTRHIGLAVHIARRVTHDFDAADLSSEAFTRILRAIRNGSGPRDEFRGYLATTIRAVAASWARGMHATVDIESIPEPAFDDERLIAIDELDSRHRAVTAFRSLPERWQTALWYSTVEGRSNTEIAEILGVRATAVGMLTLRARAGLRKAWDALSNDTVAV